MININNKGVSLVALVITIIVLLIISGITLTFVFGDNGIINKAKQAKIQTEIANAEEQIKLRIAELQVENDGDFTINDIDDIENDDIVLTADKSKIIYQNKYIFNISNSLSVSDGQEYSENQIVKVRALRVFDNFDREDR